MADEGSVEEVVAGVGRRLRAVRLERGATLASVARDTGLSVSTLSRLESGVRRATLELLLPLARAYQVRLDELVGAERTPDPRVRAEPERIGGRLAYPLSRQPGGRRAHKLVIPVEQSEPQPQSHEGYEWLYVLSGRLRLVLGDRDLVMRAGEAAEFDTRVPHWFGCAGPRPVELISLFGPQGERVHLKARTR